MYSANAEQKNYTGKQTKINRKQILYTKQKKKKRD